MGKFQRFAQAGAFQRAVQHGIVHHRGDGFPAQRRGLAVQQNRIFRRVEFHPALFIEEGKVQLLAAGLRAVFVDSHPATGVNGLMSGRERPSAASVRRARTGRFCRQRWMSSEPVYVTRMENPIRMMYLAFQYM